MSKYFLLSLLLFISEIASFSQNVINGRITDNGGNPLPGVNIVEVGTTNGAVSDLKGNYTITVSSDNAVLSFSFIGFISRTEILNGRTRIDIILDEDIQQLEEVVITAQARGQKNAIREQINSNTIKNVVAADRLQENPDANSVEAIGRLPGISVLRSGGEGSALVIRGLDPKYSAVTLNGVKLPSTSGYSRETNISGISQYILQGVEVYKALTADMEANSVAGTVNLKLREAPRGMRYNVMAQGGYNNLNNYWGNYKLQGEISNRYYGDKLGVFLSLNAERVNRGTQTMSSGYTLGTSTELNIINNGFSLNDIYRLKHRRSAMLAFDYKLHSSTKFSLYGLYSYSNDDYNSQSKNFDVENSNASYSFHDNPFGKTNIFQSTFSGVTDLEYLELDYGISYSSSIMRDPDSRSWQFNYSPRLLEDPITFDQRELPPDQLLQLFDHTNASDTALQLISFSKNYSHLDDQNISTYLNITMPFQFGSSVHGHLKFGGMFRSKSRFYDVTAGSHPIIINPPGKDKLQEELEWIVRNGITEDITAVGMREERVDGFLNGKYDFGWSYNLDKLNEITTTWAEIADYYYAQGPGVWETVFGGRDRFGFRQDIQGSMMNDQDIAEKYYAGYISSEINIGKWFMLLPGIRYENTSAEMNGFIAQSRVLPDPVQEPLIGESTYAERSNEFWLPMLHFRFKPHKNFHAHLAYTQTLSRPDFNSLSPNTFINMGFTPFMHFSSNPALLPETWENFDALLSLHGDKIGLISFNLFSKTVENKIWHRSYTRLKGDPIIDPFSDQDQVNVSVWENHEFPITLQGAEVEVQTSFWYLPKPFSYFTISANYTYTQSETHYPLSWIETQTIYPPEGGRPTVNVFRIDSTVRAPMLLQPKHIINTSLGFNREGLNMWLSFQYNGEILTGKNYKNEAMDSFKEHFYRMDLQITQKLSKKLKGFELIGNFANLTDFSEKSRLRGEPNPTYIENYGWTIDLGIRYSFK